MIFFILFFMSFNLMASDYKSGVDTIEVKNFSPQDYKKRRIHFFKELEISEYHYSLKNQTKSQVEFYGTYKKKDKKVSFLERIYLQKKKNNHLVISTYTNENFKELKKIASKQEVDE